MATYVSLKNFQCFLKSLAFETLRIVAIVEENFFRFIKNMTFRGMPTVVVVKGHANQYFMSIKFSKEV